MEKVVSELWDKVLEDIGKEVNEAQFRAWFSPVKVRPESLDENLFRVCVANRFIKSILHRNYRDLIAGSVQKHLGEKPEIEFVISGDLYQLLRRSQEEEYGGAGSSKADQTSAEASGTAFSGLAGVQDSSAGNALGGVPGSNLGNGLGNSLGNNLGNVLGNVQGAGFGAGGVGPGQSCPADATALNPAYTFETFVSGEANRLAGVSAQQAARSPGGLYNPLVIYGGHGLGKTHLLQAAVAEVREHHPALSTLFLPAETFTNEYLQAVASRSLDGFRRRLRSVDFLALDDFHFLLGKKQTLQEFRHTLDALVCSGRQVMIGTSISPREMEDVPPAVSSRMLGGLLVHVDAPDPDLRCRIAQRKARRWGGMLSDDVIAYVASHVSRNVREIEGAVAKVMALASAERRDPDISVARRALREYRALKEGPISLEAIAGKVAGKYEVDLKSLTGRSRLRSVAVPRQVAMYLSKQLTSYSLGEIGRYFGGRNHSTVLYAVNRIAAELSENRELQRIVSGIKSDLGR